MTEHIVTDPAALQALYGEPGITSLAKVADHIHPHYARMIEAAPFAVLATVGPHGLDTSPRGDAAGFVAIEDDRTLLLPDRRGNNRIDTLRNIVADPRIALLFLIPGVGETLRVNGTGVVSIDPALLDRFAVDGKRPRSVLVITVQSAFFQCSRAVIRGGLWDAGRQIGRSALPSTGTILADLSRGEVDGQVYDRDLPGRVATTLY